MTESVSPGTQGQILPQVNMPWSYECGVATTPDGARHGVLITHTVSSVTHHYAGPAYFRQLIAHLSEMCDGLEKPNLMVPANVLIGPNGRPIVFALPDGTVPPMPQPGEVGPEAERIPQAEEEPDSD